MCKDHSGLSSRNNNDPLGMILDGIDKADIRYGCQSVVYIMWSTYYYQRQMWLLWNLLLNKTKPSRVHDSKKLNTLPCILSSK